MNEIFSTMIIIHHQTFWPQGSKKYHLRSLTFRTPSAPELSISEGPAGLPNAVAAYTHLVGEMLAAEGVGYIRPVLVQRLEVVAHYCLAADCNYPAVD